MKKIIVPLDFSDESLNGLDLAIKVANQVKSKIEMVHVIKDSGDLFSATEKEQIKHAEASFKSIMDQYQNQISNDSELTYVIHKGRIHREVVNHAKYNKADMIIGSTHGASGFEELFIGSNAHRIIASSSIPTMVIRKGIAPKSFDRILLPLDDTIETRQKVPFTAELAKLFDAEIIMQSIFPTTDQTTKTRVSAYKEQVARFLEKEGIKYSEKQAEGNIVKNVLDCARECNVDLISTMAEEERTLSAFILGSNMMEITRKANVPLLCIHQQDIYKMSDVFQA